MRKQLTPNKALHTKVLSARVTPDVYQAWHSLAQGSNRTVSECLRDSVTVVDGTAVLAAEDGLSVPNDFNRVLGAIGGGTVVGILAYKGFKATFTNNRTHNLTEVEIEALSMVLGLSAALLVGVGIHKVLSK